MAAAGGEVGAAMSVTYAAVQWNRQKKLYDSVIAGGVALYLGRFVGVGAMVHPQATAETLLIRGLGTAAFLLLHVVLSIGPLTRLDRRFLPLLYNRRHLGVTMFTLALGHGVFSLVQFHALGDVPPLVSLLTAPARFEQLGLAALTILFLMAATSHDFWLKLLTPPGWKRLHMLVYLAYALLVAHVSLGALQSERNPLFVGVVLTGACVVLGLHVAAWGAGRGYVEVCEVERIGENRAVLLKLGDEKIAVFRHGGKVSAISNVCAHQGGPLSEGKIVDGCVTCPWHGYQYLPETGASPPPFTEKVAVYETKVEGGKVLVSRCAKTSSI
ncbi:MAG: ferric reductase-like transmembrane domain-containing protein [Bryobacterales bacterium]|nr:ferric reductase-like transmembrane domain-containing protein [Bryobacterales bacterium]